MPTTLSGESLTAFVDSNVMLIADLLATYPANATNLGKYARVGDLWNNGTATGVDEILRCSYDGSMYYWRPQRTDYAVTQTASSGSMTLTPLVSAPFQFFTTNLTGNMTITPSSTNTWPGCQFQINSPGVLGIFTFLLSGLLGGGTVPLLAGTKKTLTYTGAGWKSD